jgi:hypothetical protein
MILSEFGVGVDEFEQGTGWKIKPEGACRGDVCVPLPGTSAEGFDLAPVAQRLGMGVVHDPAVELWALGPASVGGRALATAEAFDLVLPDFDGSTFRLSSLRGQKVVLVAWAPY